MSLTWLSTPSCRLISCGVLRPIATRPFSSSHVLYARTKKKDAQVQKGPRRVNKTESKIRVKSKKALAARAKRKELEAAKEFALAEKLTLLEAITVLRVKGR
jgi:hypothetical protein